MYLGHIVSSRDKCNYILIPQIINYGKEELVCEKINLASNIVNNLFPELDIITYKVEKSKYKFEFLEFIKMGLKINKNILRVVISYIIAKIRSNRQEKIAEITQNRKLNNDKIKILIVSQFYNIYDKYFAKDLIEYLNNNNIQLIYPDKLLKKTAIDYSKELSNTLNMNYSKELVGAVNYYKYLYDGLLFFSSDNCCIDNMVNELLIKKINKPSLNIFLSNCNNTFEIKKNLDNFVNKLKEEKESG